MFRKFASYHSTFGKATAFAGGALLAGVGSVLYQNSPSAFALPQVHMASPGKQNERTYIMVKPDGVQRNLCGEIMKRFEQKGFKLVACKFVQPTETLLKQHYYDLRARPFYNGLVKYMASGPVLCMVWEGTGVVKMGRKMLGETNPADSLPGSIRGDYCIEIGRYLYACRPYNDGNICHGSDAVDSAEKEISLWFTPSELVEWKSTNSKWVLE